MPPDAGGRGRQDRARSARRGLRLSPLPPPSSRRGDRRPRHAGERPRGARRHSAHAVARSARALEAGATGYVLKDTSSDELMKAFDQVRSGTPYLSNDLAMQVALVRTGVRANP